jgi:hypothetical protein
MRVHDADHPKLPVPLSDNAAGKRLRCTIKAHMRLIGFASGAGGQRRESYRLVATPNAQQHPPSFFRAAITRAVASILGEQRPADLIRQHDAAKRAQRRRSRLWLPANDHPPAGRPDQFPH